MADVGSSAVRNTPSGAFSRCITCARRRLPLPRARSTALGAFSLSYSP
jgi:hypothetical protein